MRRRRVAGLPAADHAAGYLNPFRVNRPRLQTATRGSGCAISVRAWRPRGAKPNKRGGGPAITHRTLRGMVAAAASRYAPNGIGQSVPGLHDAQEMRRHASLVAVVATHGDWKLGKRESRSDRQLPSAKSLRAYRSQVRGGGTPHHRRKSCGAARRGRLRAGRHARSRCRKRAPITADPSAAG